MPRTREEMIEAAARARAAKSKARRPANSASRTSGRASAAAGRVGGRVGGRSGSRATSSGGTATATRRPRVAKLNAGGQRSGLQPIEAGCDYPLPVFMTYTGLSRATVRTCQRRGLRVRRRGNKWFISGSDWIEWNRRQDEADGIGDEGDDAEGGE